MNSQPLRIVLVRSPEARERLVQHMAPGNRARTLGAPLVAVLATDLDFHDEFHRTFPVFPGARMRTPTRNGGPGPPTPAPCSKPDTSSSACGPPDWPPGPWGA